MEREEKEGKEGRTFAACPLLLPFPSPFILAVPRLFLSSNGRKWVPKCLGQRSKFIRFFQQIQRKGKKKEEEEGGGGREEEEKGGGGRGRVRNGGGKGVVRKDPPIRLSDQFHPPTRSDPSATSLLFLSSPLPLPFPFSLLSLAPTPSLPSPIVPIVLARTIGHLVLRAQLAHSQKEHSPNIQRDQDQRFSETIRFSAAEHNSRRTIDLARIGGTQCRSTTGHHPSSI